MGNDDFQATGNRARGSSWDQVGTRSGSVSHLTAGTVGARVEARVEARVATGQAPSRHQVEILRNCLTEKTIRTLMAFAGRKDRTKFRNQVLKPLLDAGWLGAATSGRVGRRAMRSG